jgi:hypothetical protein
MTSDRPSSPWTYYVATALSLWVGWGIRGNFGHEYGAMMPGALAALSVCLMSGRPDWHVRAAEFALLGALGWSFGGSISYMQVVAYTHSGDSASVLYGFACLFVIGFLWAAPGGAGTALAALASRRFLSDLLLPMSIVFALWWLQGAWIAPELQSRGHRLNWFDTDWLAALLAIIGGLLTLAIRRRLDPANGLVLSMGIGWWAGFGILVLGLGLRMTPPRGDNWSGCLGMTLGALWWLRRIGLAPAARAGLVCGFAGGIGFAAASMLKLVEVTSGYETNWHSILEQTTGLFNGLALAVAMSPLLRSAPAADDDAESPASRRTASYALAFVVLGITYLNLRKNAGEWVRVGAMPKEMAGLSTGAWFDLAYLLIALTFLTLWIRHARAPLAILPSTTIGRAQLLYVVLLWWLIVGNFERAVVRFAPQRLVTEGVIGAVGLACTLLVVAWPPRTREAPPPHTEDAGRPRLARTLLVGLLTAAASILLDWAVVRAIYGDTFAGHASLHIRFGPRATIQQR